MILAELWRNTELRGITGKPLPGESLDNFASTIGTHPDAEDALSVIIREGNYRGSVNERLAGHPGVGSK